jgi:hypothetical protein
VRLGGVETLRTIVVRPVSYIRHYNGIDATARWGLDHGSGVIYVSTRPVVLPTSVGAQYDFGLGLCCRWRGHLICSSEDFSAPA